MNIPKICLLIAILLLGGCNGQQSPPQSSSHCPMINHENGSTPICDSPEKVVALSPYVLDLLLSLDIQPDGFSAAYPFAGRVFDNPQTQIPYIGNNVTSQPLNTGDRHNPSLETLVMIKPDVIIAEHWQGDNKYAIFNQISPTILINEEKGGWRRDLMTIAKVFDQERKAKEIIKIRDDNIDSARQQLASMVANHPRILLLSSGGIAEGFYDYGQSPSIYSRILTNLGFEIVEVDNFINGEGGIISLEALAEINADMIIVLAWNNENRQDTHQWKVIEAQWKNNPILSNLDTFQQGKVYFLDAYLTMVRGAMAEDIIIQEILSLFKTSSQI